MGFSSRSWDYFHYSDSRGYLIFCCHGVAMKATFDTVILPFRTANSNIFFFALRVFIGLEHIPLFGDSFFDTIIC